MTTTVLLGLLALAGCSSRNKAGKAVAAKLAPAALAPTDVVALRAAPESLSLPEAPQFSVSVGKKASGVLRVHLEAEPAQLNPLDDNQQVVHQITDGLIYETLIECRDGRYLPGLADSWEVAPDGHRITLHLRDGVRWHDGHPFGVLDVQATVEPLLRASSRVASLRSLLADVAAIEILSGRLVRLRLHRPSDLVLRALCEVPVLPDHLLRAGSAELASLARLPIGTGPFRLLAWDRGKRIRLGRNTDTWGDPSRSAHLDEIVFEIDTDGARTLSRTRRGEIDILPRMLEVHYPEQVESAALQDNLRLYRLTPDRYSFLLLNHRRDILASSEVRHALSVLWDRGSLARDVHRGLVRPIGAPPFGHVAPDPFDRATALRLLDDAGFRDGNGDGVRDRKDVPIHLTVLQPTGARALAQELKAYALELRRAGLLLDIVTVDPSTMFARIKVGNFDIAPMIWEGRADDDPRLLFGPQGELNASGFRSEQLAELFDALPLAPGPAARRPLLGRIAEQLAMERPVVFLYCHDTLALCSGRVHGLSAVGDRLDLRAVWVDP